MSMKFGRYYRAIQFLNSLVNLPRDDYMANLRKSRGNASWYLARTQALLDEIGNPEKKLSFIHVAGTSGKGTTTAHLHSILRAAGKKVGSFYSPYVSVPIEKILVNELYIAPRELAAIVGAKIKPALERLIVPRDSGGFKTRHYKDNTPSYFEVWLAIALFYFAQKKCEIAVLETGLGGEFDATNVIKRPLVSVITSIGLDHTEILGPTLADIAHAKAGIIKKGCPVVVGKIPARANNIIQKKARLNNAQLINSRISPSVSTIPFPGPGQHNNALCAATAARIIGIPDRAVIRGIARTRFPVRCEIMQKKPRVMLDGAHNPDKMRELDKVLESLTYQKLFLIIAVKGKKDARAMMKIISPRARHICVTRFLTPEFASAALFELSRYAKMYASKGTRVSAAIDPYDALDRALAEAGPGDLVLATGSIYMVGELRKKWYSEDHILLHRKSF